MDIILFLKTAINILKEIPLDNKRKVALSVLERFLKLANGERTNSPTKDELNITIDVIKELKQNNAKTREEYQFIEKQAKHAKAILNCILI